MSDERYKGWIDTEHWRDRQTDQVFFFFFECMQLGSPEKREQIIHKEYLRWVEGSGMAVRGKSFNFYFNPCI